jgi:curved DNA-binding protein CbpA
LRQKARMSTQRTVYVKTDLFHRHEIVISRKKNGKLVREAIEVLLKNDICFDSGSPPVPIPLGFVDASAVCADGLKYLESQPHEALSVNINATADDVRSSYKKMALKYHPDRNPKTNELFLLVKNAHDRLLENVPAANTKVPSADTSNTQKNTAFPAKPSPRQQPASNTSHPKPQTQAKPAPPSKTSASRKPNPTPTTQPPEAEKVFHPHKPSVPPPASGVSFDHHRRQRYEDQRRSSNATASDTEPRKPAPYSFKAPPDVRASHPSTSSIPSPTQLSYEAAMKINFDKTNLTKEYNNELLRQASFRAYDRIQQKLNSRQSMYNSQQEPTPTPDHPSYVPKSPPSSSSPKPVGIPLIPGPCNVQLQAIDATVVEISWQKPISLASSSAVCDLSYAIELSWRLCSSSTDTTSWESSNKLVTGDRCRKRNLQSGSRYEFRIRAVMELAYDKSGADRGAIHNPRLMKSEWTPAKAILMPLVSYGSPAPSSAKKDTAYMSSPMKTTMKSPYSKASPKPAQPSLEKRASPTPNPSDHIASPVRVEKAPKVPIAMRESTDSLETSAMTVDEIDSVNINANLKPAAAAPATSTTASPLKSSLHHQSASSSFSRSAWMIHEDKTSNDANTANPDTGNKNRGKRRKSSIVNLDGLSVDDYVEDECSDSGDDEVKEESIPTSEDEADDDEDIEPTDKWFTLIPPLTPIFSTQSPRMPKPSSYRRNSKSRQTSSSSSQSILSSLNADTNAYQHLVRAEPIPNSKVIGYLVLEKRVQVRAECGSWFKVKIHKQHLVNNAAKQSKNKEFIRTDGWGWCVAEEPDGCHRYLESVSVRVSQPPSPSIHDHLLSNLSPNSRPSGFQASFSPRKPGLHSHHPSRPVSSQQPSIPTIHESELEGTESEVHTWYEKKDVDSGYYYYYNAHTNESKWEAPEWIEEYDNANQAQ